MYPTDWHKYKWPRLASMWLSNELRERWVFGDRDRGQITFQLNRRVLLWSAKGYHLLGVTLDVVKVDYTKIMPMQKIPVYYSQKMSADIGVVYE